MCPSILQLLTRHRTGAPTFLHRKRSSCLRSTCGRRSPCRCTMQIVQPLQNPKLQPNAPGWFLCKRVSSLGEAKVLVRASGGTGPLQTKSTTKTSYHLSIALFLVPALHLCCLARRREELWQRCRWLSVVPATNVAKLGILLRIAH